MAISVGDAVLKVGVDTKAVDKGLRGLKGQIMKHNKAIGLAMTAVGGAILAIGVKSVQTYAKMGDEVQKMALRTGFSTEALSELRHAAEISGAELSTLEKGTKRMAKTIIDASEGMATYIRAVDRIGLSAEELIKLKPEEQFNTIAMAIAGLEDPTLRAATAQDIFGRAGTQLLPLFATGAEGIAELREEAHKLGIVFDQEAANKAAELTDAMHRMKESVSGIKIAIAEHLAPIITELADKIKNVMTAISGWIKEHPGLSKAIFLTTGMVGGLLVVLGPLLIMLPGITAGIGGVKAALIALHIPLTTAMGLVAGLTAGLALLAVGLFLLYQHQQKAEMMQIEYNKALKGEASIYPELLKATYDRIDAKLKLGKASEEEYRWMVNNQGAILDYLATVEKTGTGTDDLTVSTEALTQTYSALSESVNIAKDDLTEFHKYVMFMEKYYAEKRIALGIERMAIAFPVPAPIPGGRISRRQEGGVIAQPTLALLGEQAPRVKEYVFNERQLGMLGYRTANIYFQVDGRTLARVLGEPLVDEIRLKTGLHI